MNGKRTIRHDESGSVLLYAVLSLAVMVNVMIIVTNIVVIEIRQSANVDQSTRAWYVAESGIEKSLYAYRKEETTLPDGDCGFAGKVCSLAISTNSVTSYRFRLDPNESFELPLTADESVVESLKLTWQSSNGSWLEVTLMEWDPLALNWSDSNVNKVLLSGGSGFINAPQAGKRYKIRVKGLYALAGGDLALYSGNNGTGAAVTIPSSVSFVATGDYGSSSQRLTVTMPPAPSVHGLFDYVLFSERPVVK
jgi:hypothetical protein